MASISHRTFGQLLLLSARDNGDAEEETVVARKDEAVCLHHDQLFCLTSWVMSHEYALHCLSDLPHSILLPDCTALAAVPQHTALGMAYARLSPLEFWGSPVALEFLSTDHEGSIFWGTGLEVLLLCPMIFSNSISMYSFSKYLLNTYWMPRVGYLPFSSQWQQL